MKLIVANEIDETFWFRKEGRAWAQRSLWFADPGDVVILPAAANTRFSEQVSTTLGFASGPEILQAPPGRYGDKVLDPLALTDSQFLRRMRSRLRGEASVQFLSLFPSPALIPFCEAVGLNMGEVSPKFLELGGINAANSKAIFHLLAMSSETPTPEAVVAYSAAEASALSRRLLNTYGAVVVKRAHAGGGAGNELISLTSRDVSHLGIRGNVLVADARDAVAAYFHERWEWASSGGRYPVVIEEFVETQASGYIDFLINQSGSNFLGHGELAFQDVRIVHEYFGKYPSALARPLEAVAGAKRLADSLQRLGYRGHAEFDFVVRANGDHVFTECNARSMGQVTGQLTGTSGSHLYRIREALDVDANQIVQHAVSSAWPWISTETF